MKQLLAIAALVLATSCAPIPPEGYLGYKEDFWQRKDLTSALYLRGEEAQQRLNKDIAECAYAIRELQNDAPVRERIPANNVGGVPPDPQTAEGRLAQWDTPEREGDLRYEHRDYHDFETCMLSKGWARQQFVPPEVAEEARDVYYETVTGERRGKSPARPKVERREKQRDLDPYNE